MNNGALGRGNRASSVLMEEVDFSPKPDAVKM